MSQSYGDTNDKPSCLRSPSLSNQQSNTLFCWLQNPHQDLAVEMLMRYCVPIPLTTPWSPLPVHSRSHFLAHKDGCRKVMGTKKDSDEWGKGGGQGRVVRDRAIGILLQPGPSQVGLTSDSPRTQICILGCWIATGKRASHTEAPACPQTAGYSRQSQGSVQWSPRGLAGNMGVDEGRRPPIRSVALTALASLWCSWGSHPHPNSIRLVPVQPWSGSS